ncbi:extracellular solute-binding protein [Pseudactinotalea terrae]|uniref:ABC transporter substrate-binding protein n=1 Tax=Pseudactinotalea terrae TaxID=1743262 RepID=UPI0012E16CA2|nr:extracellular solute-binding protein [Pseudactinotalea terrae]
MSETRTPLSRRSVLRGALFTAAAVPFGIGLAACDTGDVGGEGGGGDDAGGSDLSDKMVGAMEDYDVGTTFVATEALAFNVLYRDHPNYPLKDDWSFLTHISEDNNVSFDFTSVPLSDFEDRRSLLIAAGDAPTVITQAYAGTLDQFVPSGALLPVSKYIDHLPNYRAKVEAWGLQADLDRTRQIDGEYYVLPGLLESAKPGYSFAIRDDLWQAAGLTDPATFEEFREQMREVKAKNPDLEYVLSDRWNSGGPMEATLSACAPNFGVRAGWGFGDGTVWNGSAYEFTGAMDGYRQLVAFFASLVEEGLMDPESITQDDDAAIQKLTNGRTAVIGSNDQEILTYRTNLADAGNADAVLRQIVVPAGPAGDIIDTSRFESGVALSSSALEQDNFVALLQFIDWLYYSDQGLEFAKWGVEGETFTRTADGKRELMPDIDINGLNPGAPKMLNADFGYHNGVFMPAHGSTQDLVSSMLREEVVDFLAKMNEKEQLDLGPGFLLNELDAEQVALKQTALKDASYQATAAFILGQRSLDDWDAYVGELEAADMPGYLEIINGSLRES